MKKIFLPVALLAVCALAYFSMQPDKQPHTDESDVMAYLDTGQAESDYMEDSEVQAFVSLGFEEPQPMEEEDIQAYTPKKKRYYAVRHYKPRASTLGFSITPPPGAHWYEKLEDDSLYYVKINKSHKRYAILTEAREVKLHKKISSPEDIKSYVHREKEQFLSSARFTKPHLAVQIENSLAEQCVRYSHSYQDHALKGLSERSYVEVTTQGIFCLHPENTRAAIDMNYVEKSLSNTQVKSYGNEGEKFLASLKFNRLMTR